jgi:DNA-binding GntR family transcriptional regulator
MRWQSRVRLVDEVAAVLRDRIYAGDFPPGMRIRQEQLAAELEISRTPLREALRVLEREGLLRVEPNRAVRVISADLPTLLSAYEVREVLDGLAARLAARHTSEELVRELAVIIDRQRETIDPWDAVHYTEANVEFHAAIIRAADNEFLVAQLPLVPLTAQVFTPVALAEPSRAERAVTEHVGIVEAIADGHEDTAERRARTHIRATIDQLAAGAASEAHSPAAVESAAE